MRAKSISPFFHFGTCVRYLQDVREGWAIHGDAKVIGNLESLFYRIDNLNLQVTYRAARELGDSLKMLKQTPADAKLTKEQASEVTKLVTDLRKTLVAEIEGFEAYLVTPKRIDVSKLLDDVSALFAPDVFDNLPEIACYDFAEAGKCIAFERPTGASFHMLRATEAVLKSYYCTLIKRNRVSLMWGPMVQDLKKKRAGKGKTTLLNNLDNIRVSFRNPTQHPEKIYDIQEAQDLWALCVDVVNRMVADLKAHEA